MTRNSNRVELAYQQAPEQSQHLLVEASEERIDVEAWATLSQPVYSHLNSFCELIVSGHKQLSLEFSPCPGHAIEVLPADYPFGRPCRLAYVDDTDNFCIVEARNGEKGPFRTLAKGRLDATEPLVITLLDSSRRVVRLTVFDWASQSGRSLSPTAGWGLPVNAIEFRLLGDSSADFTAIWFTSAGTSVGRGWDSVGHRAGTYRNHIRIEPLPAKE